MNFVEINGWKANIRFSSSHIMPEYNKCGRLHGHTYAVHLRIYGEPDENGIIMDFKLMKKILREIVDEFDHKVLIASKNPSVKILGEEIKIQSKGKRYILPKEDCAILPITSTSAENLARYILDKVLDVIKEKAGNIRKIEIGVDEGVEQGARVSKEL